MQQSGSGSASFIGLVLRGLAMGIAELVPGVSGGTIAFMTGIYLQLVRTLASFGVDSIAMIGRPKQFWQHHNLSFLLSLGLGMGIGVVIFAQVIRYSLANFPPLIWAFSLVSLAHLSYIWRASAAQTHCCTTRCLEWFWG